MSIPNYDKWMKETSALGKPRGAALKLVDEAIQGYEKNPTETSRTKVWTFLNYWKYQKGEWEKSVRNKSGAITRLNDELADIATMTNLPPKEQQALDYWFKTRKEAITRLFEEKKVTFKTANLVQQLRSAKSQMEVQRDAAIRSHPEWHENPLYKPPSSGPKWHNNPLYEPPKTPSIPGVPQRPKPGSYAPPPTPMGKSALKEMTIGGLPKSTSEIKEYLRKKAEDMAEKIFEVDNLTALGPLTNLVLNIVKEAIPSIAPLLGHIKDGVDVVGGWIEVGVTQYKAYNIAERKYSLDLGVPLAAFEALVEIMDDEKRDAVIGVSMATGAFALKTGLMFADGGTVSGPVVGALKAVGEIIHKLVLLGIEWRATKAVNEKLKAGVLDITLFKTYPLMGCYLLVCADLSDLIPIGNFGMPGWMDAVEKLKKKGYDKIHKAANEFIDKSPWEIKGMPKRGVLTRGVGALPGMVGTANTGFEFAEVGKIGKG